MQSNKQRLEQSCFAFELSLVYCSLEQRTLPPPPRECCFPGSLLFCILTRPEAAWALTNYLQHKPGAGLCVSALKMHKTLRPCSGLCPSLLAPLGWPLIPGKCAESVVVLREPPKIQGRLLGPLRVCSQGVTFHLCWGLRGGLAQRTCGHPGDVRADCELHLHEIIAWGCSLSLYPQNYLWVQRKRSGNVGGHVHSVVSYA